MPEVRKYADFISSFEAGMNSGIAPQLLPKNQLAFATNVSLRGGFAKPRPPLQRKTLNFIGDTGLENLLSTGFFQGAGYYRPDYGTESLVASIGGRLAKFTENGEVWDVTEISIPDDWNNSDNPQAWMWQSEKWLIVNDGTGILPIFYDGNTSRRSYGPTQTYGITAAPFDVQPIGTIFTITLNQPYTGPFGVPLIIHGEFYQAMPNASGFELELTNILGNPSANVPAGTSVVINPNIVGFTAAQATSSATYISTPTHIVYDDSGATIFPVPFALNGPFTGGPAQICSIYDITIVLQMEEMLVLSVGDLVSMLTNDGFHFWTVKAIAGDLITLQRRQTTCLNRYTADIAPPPHPSVAFKGTQVLFGTSRGASFIVGKTTTNFTVPDVGQTVDIFIDQTYSGQPNQLVFINGVRWVLNVTSFPAGSTSLVVQNMTDPFDPDTPVTVPIGTKVLSVPELPAGRMGAYGMGRNWMSLTDGISYYAGDIVGGPSGTPANNFRDAVLKTTENDYLSGGGSFRLPGTGDIISSMIFPPLLDTSLGQGQLMVGTPFTVFSNNSPVDRSVWESITSPLQTESLKDQGPLSQNSTVIVNSDMLFRSYNGFGSLVLAKREFANGTWGNRPISNELQRITNPDNRDLLVFGSALSYDNRFLATVSPQASPQGVSHSGLVSLNNDLLSSLRETIPPCWEGLWLGMNALQIISGRVNGTLRAFAFNYNADEKKIELLEILQDSTNEFKDNGDTDITWGFETPVLFNKDVKEYTDLMKLSNGEIYVSDIRDTVRIDVFYRPDYYPCWVLWNSISLCNDTAVTNANPTYKTRVGLGSPDATRCESSNQRPINTGFFFQFKFVIYGHCIFNGIRVEGDQMPQAAFAPPPC